jgi:hypothetical protein
VTVVESLVGSVLQRPISVFSAFTVWACAVEKETVSCCDA